MVNLTTCIAVQNPHLPLAGLKQHDINRAVKLDKRKIYEQVFSSDTSVEAETSRYFITQGVRSVHAEAVAELFPRLKKPKDSTGAQAAPVSPPEMAPATSDTRRSSSHPQPPTTPVPASRLRQANRPVETPVESTSAPLTPVSMPPPSRLLGRSTRTPASSVPTPNSSVPSLLSSFNSDMDASESHAAPSDTPDDSPGTSLPSDTPDDSLGASLPSFPFVDRLPPTKTKLEQLGAAFHNEGTIEGTLAVHESIWLEKLGYKRENNIFKTRLWPTYGDQLTAQHIRSVQGRLAESRLPFDRREHIVPGIGWFHVLQAMVYLIIRTHFESEDASDGAHCTLLHDIKEWGRKGLSRDSAKYYQFEPLIQQGFNSRISALWYESLQARGKLEAAVVDEKKAFDAAIASLSQEEFQAITEEIRLKAFTLDAWSSASQAPHDKEFQSMCRYLQEVEMFYTLKTAIKHGDVGMLRRLVPRLSAMFFGAGQYKYGHEMLHLNWLLSDAVSAPHIQRAILAGSLVNLKGLPNTWKPIDLAMEHINYFYKEDMKLRKNSTHDMYKTFDDLAALSGYAQTLRTKFEMLWGEKTTGKHSPKVPTQDMWSLALKLYKKGFAVARNRGTGPQFESPDILKAGAEALGEKIKDFNQRELRAGVRRDIPFAEGNSEVPLDHPLNDTAAHVEHAETSGEGDEFLDIDYHPSFAGEIDLSQS